MRVRNKILLDRCVGVPAMFALNFLARLLGILLKRDHSIQAESVRCIVVSKFVGMGSILQSTPMLRMLRRRFPNAQLIFVTGIENSELLERLEDINERLYIDDRSLWKLWWSSCRTAIRLMSDRADLYFDLEVYSAYASGMALLSLARNRFGFYRHSPRFKRGTYTHLVYFNTRRPVRKIYLQLAALATQETARDADQLGPLQILSSDRDALTTKLKSLGLRTDEIGSPYVVVNPNASDLLLERRWPADRFLEVISHLVARGFGVALTGSKSEHAYVDALLKQVPTPHRTRVYNTAGSLSLGEFFALIAQANCVLTNDTGPFHMAAALGVPVVGLFGPGDPVHYGICRIDVATLYVPVFCSPCLYEADEPPCAGNNVCMLMIQPNQVLEAIERVVSAQSPNKIGTESGHVVDDKVVYNDPQGLPLGVLIRNTVPLARPVDGGNQ